MGALGNELLKDLTQTGCRDGFPVILPADGAILAEYTPQDAPGKKYGAAAFGAADGRLLPVVEAARATTGVAGMLQKPSPRSSVRTAPQRGDRGYRSWSYGFAPSGGGRLSFSLL